MTKDEIKTTVRCDGSWMAIDIFSLAPYHLSPLFLFLHPDHSSPPDRISFLLLLPRNSPHFTTSHPRSHHSIFNSIHTNFNKSQSTNASTHIGSLASNQTPTMAALTPNSCIQYRDLCTRDYGMQLPNSSGRSCSVVGSSGPGLLRRLESDGMVLIKGKARGQLQKLGAFWQDVSRPTSIDMESISSLEEFEDILRLSKENSQPIIVDWMAAWCRKCIYLKPKLEKLAAEFYPRIKFYFVDVNKVPQTLVKRGNISKMPTIQLWKDGEWKAEVIGGHKAWLVLDEVRDMIQKNV